MGRNPKFAVLEIDGDELGGPSEYIPEAEDIKWIASSSETLKEHIDNLEVGESDPYLYGVLDRDITIPSDKALIMVNPRLKNYTIKIKGTWRIEWV